jgi:hypothetical protein
MGEHMNHSIRAVNAFLSALTDFLITVLNFLQYLCQLTHSLQTGSRYQAKSRKCDEDISFLQRPMCCNRKHLQCSTHRQHRSWACQNKYSYISNHRTHVKAICAYVYGRVSPDSEYCGRCESLKLSLQLSHLEGRSPIIVIARRIRGIYKL